MTRIQEHTRVMTLQQSDIHSLAEAIQALNTEAGTQPSSVQAASLKLPEFWTDNPEVWFARVEAQFNTKGINQDTTKYDYIVASLDNSTASEVGAVLLNPPENNRYTALKGALLQAFAKSQEQKDAELLSLSSLGDMKPTALLRKLLSLNSDTKTLLRAHFLALLPTDVRSVLAGREIPDLDELAKTADRVLEAKRFDTLVHSVDFPVAAPVSKPGSNFSRRSARQSHSAKPNSSKHVCDLHVKYGSQAFNCRGTWCLLHSLPRATPTSSPAQGNA